MLKLVCMCPLYYKCITDMDPFVAASACECTSALAEAEARLRLGQTRFETQKWLPFDESDLHRSKNTVPITKDLYPTNYLG